MSEQQRDELLEWADKTQADAEREIQKVLEYHLAQANRHLDMAVRIAEMLKIMREARDERSAASDS